MKPIIYYKNELEVHDLANISYSLSVLAYPNGSPWSKEHFLLEIQNEHSYYILLKQEDVWLGFISYLMILDEAEVTQIVVHPSYQGKGLGNHLIEHLVHCLSIQSVQQVFLEVRVSNQKAYALYRKNGFSEMTTRKNYYRQPVEDGIVMCLNLKEVNQ